MSSPNRSARTARGAQSLRDAARIELGLRAFLDDGGFRAFTDTFENLHGLKQLPGVAAQRLMADGYGFGAEGDWKTAALVRAMKVMAVGMKGGTSFMEDYTYHLDPANPLVLGAHMLEICPSIAADRPSLEIHPLSIGGKEDPVRLVFDAPPGPAINAAILDLGDRFRMLVNEVDVVAPLEPLPKLPVARAVWRTRARSPNRGRRLDPRRRPAPHQLQPGRHDRTARSVRRNGRRRARGDRRRHVRADVQKNPALERGVLQLSSRSDSG